VIGLDRAGGEAHAAVALVALSLIGAAWVLALRAAWKRRLSLPLVIGLALALHVFVLWLPLLGSRDAFSYIAYGSIVSKHGANPYVVTPIAYPGDAIYRFVSVAWRAMPAAYWPLFVRISGTVAGHARTLSGAVDAFRALAAVASLVAMAAVAVAARKLAPERAAFAAAMVGLSPVMLFATVGGGHADALLAMLVACAMGALALSAPLPGTPARPNAPAGLTVTALLAAATMIKPIAAPLLIVHVAAACGRGTTTLRRVGSVVLHGALALAIAGPIAGPFLSRADPTLGIADAGHAINAYSPLRLILAIVQAVPGLSGNGGAAHGAVAALVTATAVALVGLLAWRMWRSRPAPVDREAEAWAWTALVVLLCLPLINPWYLAFVLPLAWLLPTMPRFAVIAAAAILPVTLAAVQYTRAPVVFNGMVWLGRVAVGPALLVLLAWTAWAIVGCRRGAAPGALARTLSDGPRRTRAAASPRGRPEPRSSRPGGG
jgi:hypothetical protein